MISINNRAIVQYIYQIKSVIPKLMERLKTGSAEAQLETVQFLLEICRADKEHSRDSLLFFESLLCLGLVTILARNVKSTKTDSTMLLTLSAELLVEVTKIVTSKVKGLLLGNPELLRSLIQMLFGQYSECIKNSVMAIVQQIMDPADKKPEFEPLYDSVFKCLIWEIENQSDEQFKPNSLEMLILLVNSHSTRVHQAIIQGNLFQMIIDFLRGNSKHVKVLAIKLLKAVILTKDGVIHAFLAKSNIMEEFIKVIKEIKKDCLIIGTIRDMIKGMIKQNNVNLMTNLASKIEGITLKQHQLIPELKIIKEKFSIRPIQMPLIEPKTFEESKSHSKSLTKTQSIAWPHLPVIFSNIKHETLIPRKRPVMENSEKQETSWKGRINQERVEIRIKKKKEEIDCQEKYEESAKEVVVDEDNNSL